MTKIAICFTLLLAACHKCPQAGTTPAPTGGTETGGGTGSTPAPDNLRFTEINFSCAGNGFYLTTSTPDGECSTTTDGEGRVNGGTCSDKHGNSATAECTYHKDAENGTWADGRCVKTAGQGACNGGGGY